MKGRTPMHSHASHSHPHEHLSVLPARRQEARARAVAAITVAMMVLELAVGALSGSLALTADGWHMASHAGALGLSALAYWFARTRAGSSWFSFGTGKVYALAGYAIGDAFAFAVDFRPHGSVGAWSGHHVADERGERLVSLWHLARPVQSAAGDGDVWGAILAGADEFQRIG